MEDFFFFVIFVAFVCLPSKRIFILVSRLFFFRLACKLLLWNEHQVNIDSSSQNTRCVKYAGIGEGKRRKRCFCSENTYSCWYTEQRRHTRTNKKYSAKKNYYWSRFYNFRIVGSSFTRTHTLKESVKQWKLAMSAANHWKVVKISGWKRYGQKP